MNISLGPIAHLAYSGNMCSVVSRPGSRDSRASHRYRYRGHTGDLRWNWTTKGPAERPIGCFWSGNGTVEQSKSSDGWSSSILILSSMSSHGCRPIAVIVWAWNMVVAKQMGWPSILAEEYVAKSCPCYFINQHWSVVGGVKSTQIKHNKTVNEALSNNT